MEQPFASHSSRNQKGGCMQSGPSRGPRQSLEERAVALLSQDVDRLSTATQSCIPVGDLSQARENLAVMETRLHEVEELLREIDQSDSQPCYPTEEHAAPPESQKRDDRVFRAPCQACGQVYPLRLYQVGWRYRWLCYRCRQKQFPASVPVSPRDVED
jgi:hypothetical protein